jgi:methionyl-tRNA formyltransferase
MEVRPAVQSDMEQLYSWVNDPESLSAKLLTRQPIAKSQHEKWYEQRLVDPDTQIWIGEIDGKYVGQVRTELDHGMMEIDVFVSPLHRGKGAARTLVNFAASQCVKIWPKREVFARILHSNFASKQLFSSAGYRLDRAEDDHIIMVLGRKDDWWKGQKEIQIVVDNPSWITGYAQILADKLRDFGDQVVVLDNYDASRSVDVNLLLGCTKLAPPEFLSRARASLCVHESNLPSGKGFSPLTWQIIEGLSDIPINLFYATNEGDAGPVVYRENMSFEGHELIDEIREIQGLMTVDLCTRFFSEPAPPLGIEQEGTASYYRRRTPADSELDPQKTLAELFDQLRIVDKIRYPAHITFRGHKYRVHVEKI